MKNPKSIISHLFQNSLKLNEQRCFNKLRSLLPHSLREMIHYAYRRGKVLYLVLKHPGFVMEVNYNKKLIKELLTHLKNKEPYCNEMEIDEIRAYAKFIEKTTQPANPFTRYKEHATGKFKSSQEFDEIFEEIKKAIKQNAQIKVDHPKSS